MKRFIILVSCISTFTWFVNGFSLNTKNQKITLDFLSQKRRISSSSSLLLASDDENDNNEKPDDCERNNNVSIEYCTGCKWMLRSTWFAQELLSTFDDDENLYSVTLIPSRSASAAGKFVVTLNDVEIWNRKEEGRFPEAKELKQRVRDIISPQRNLGHSDVSTDDVENQIKNDDTQDDTTESFDSIDIIDDDDEAEEMRKYFGVA